jgi:hypothetical protein
MHSILLESIHAFIKFAQRQNVFVCDFVAAIKLDQFNLFGMYCDQSSKIFCKIFLGLQVFA